MNTEPNENEQLVYIKQLTENHNINTCLHISSESTGETLSSILEAMGINVTVETYLYDNSASTHQTGSTRARKKYSLLIFEGNFDPAIISSVLQNNIPYLQDTGAACIKYNGDTSTLDTIVNFSLQNNFSIFIGRNNVILTHDIAVSSVYNQYDAIINPMAHILSPAHIHDYCHASKNKREFLGDAKNRRPCQYKHEDGEILPLTQLPANIDVIEHPETFYKNRWMEIKSTLKMPDVSISFIPDISITPHGAHLYSPTLNTVFVDCWLNFNRWHDHVVATGQLKHIPVNIDSLNTSVYAAATNTPITINEPCILLQGPNMHNHNYGHWLTHLLPRFWYLDEIPELKDLPIAIPTPRKAYEIDMLRMAGVTQKRFIFLEEGKPYQFRNAYFPSIISDYGVSRKAAIWLGEIYDKYKSKNASSTNRYIYVSRRDADWRRPKNEDEIEKLLLERGFKIITLAECNLDEKIKYFRNAEVVVGHHGAGLANVPFCRPGTHIIDIAQSKLYSPAIWIMSNVAKTPYWLIPQLSESDELHSDYVVDLEPLKLTIDAILN